MDCNASSLCTSPSSSTTLLEPCAPNSATDHSTSFQLSERDDQLNGLQSYSNKANSGALNSSANGSTTSLSGKPPLGFISACTSSTLDPTIFDAGLPKDIAQSLSFPPALPVIAKYPSTTFSKASRCFNAAWYKWFNWLEYSIGKDAFYCYPCRLFGLVSPMARSRPEQAFGFKRWKHAAGKQGVLVGHSNSTSHKSLWWHGNSIELILNMELCFPTKLTILGIQDNKHYLKTIAELCSKQNISIHGHREGEESEKFLEMFDLIANHDPVMRRRIVSIKMQNIHRQWFRMTY